MVKSISQNAPAANNLAHRKVRRPRCGPNDFSVGCLRRDMIRSVVSGGMIAAATIHFLL